jgi:hypothetical protein
MLGRDSEGKGRVEHAASGVRVRVQLIYPKKQHEESAEADVEDGRFNIPVEFLTESRKGLINNLGEKCNRRPQTVVLSVMIGEQEADSISLDFVRDFEKSDASAYTAKREILLQGQQR